MTSSRKFFEIIKGPVNIRRTPNGEITKYQLQLGDKIEVLPDSRREVNGFVWWNHHLGWSAERDIAMTNVIMQEITPPEDDLAGIATLPQAATKGIGVVDAEQSATTPAKITQLTQMLNQTQEVPQAPPADPERVLAPDPKADLKARLLPGNIRGMASFKALQAVRIRSEPSTAATAQPLGFISAGQVVLCDVDSLTESTGFYWLKHDAGWSAWRSVDGTSILMALTDEAPSVTVRASSTRPTDLSQLPNYGRLFSRLPVNLSDTVWFQYFGNNVFAYVNGKAFGYDGYSQGLHGGLDFGNSNRAGVPVFAGVMGVFHKAETDKPKNYRIWVQVGDYMVIYQHINNLRNFTQGQAIMPETLLAEIEPSSAGGYDHLHLEVRYQTKWIINPLLLMPHTMTEQITSKFNPQRPNTNFKSTASAYEYFYQDARWNKWVTPEDQPLLELSGSLIGPRA